MQVNFKDLIKDQAVYLGIAAVSAIASTALVVVLLAGCFNSMKTFNAQSQKFKELTKEKATVEEQLAQEEQDRINNPPAKTILQLKADNFGTDASFAPLFDNVISLAKLSGIRIRSVGYNYSPDKDPIFQAGIQGYNVCELQMTTVGTYTQIQSFLKNILAQSYLVNLAKVEIVSWKSDQSVLISNLSIRFYTNTP